LTFLPPLENSKYGIIPLRILARFKVSWTIAGISIFGVIAMMLFSGSESPLSQNNIQESIKTEFSEDIEDYLMELYYSTVKKYSDGQISISDP